MSTETKEISNIDMVEVNKVQLWHSYIAGYNAVEFLVRLTCNNTDLIFTKDGWKVDDKNVSLSSALCSVPFEFVKAFITKLSKELSLSSRQNKKLNFFLFREQVYDLHKEIEVKKVPLLEKLAVKFLRLKNYNVYKSWSDQ